jgi:hypothetical protein
MLSYTTSSPRSRNDADLTAARNDERWCRVVTARALLNPQSVAHLAKLCGMLGSAHAGERAAAALMADRFVRQVLRVTWLDVLRQPPPDWRWMAQICRDRSHLLSGRERAFVASMACWHKPPSDKQLCWLTAIFERVQQRERAA